MTENLPTRLVFTHKSCGTTFGAPRWKAEGTGTAFCPVCGVTQSLENFEWSNDDRQFHVDNGIPLPKIPGVLA